MSNKLSRKTFIIVSGMAFSLLVSTPTFASTIDATGGQASNERKMGHSGVDRGAISGIVGTVASITGSTLMVNGKNSTLYSVDATSAQILKDKSTAMIITDIKVGDMVMVKGKITGTTVVATVIKDGIPALNLNSNYNRKFPGIMGIVNSLDGTTFTVTNESGVVYTIDASHAVITKGVVSKKPATVQIADIKTGDTVMVMGAVNGTSVTAEKIFDGKFKTKVLGGKGNMKSKM